MKTLSEQLNEVLELIQKVSGGETHKDDRLLSLIVGRLEAIIDNLDEKRICNKNK